MDARHSRPVILCVDDSEAALQLRKLLLESKGYKVLVAVNARAALALFRNNDVDLVLTEQCLPLLSSHSLLVREMKRLKPHVPVAIFSADPSPAAAEMRYADLFITKLAPTDELFATIDELLHRGRTAAAA